MRNPKTSLLVYSSVLLVAAIWLPSSTVRATAGRNKQTMSETLPVYAITNYTDLLNSSRCRTEVETFREGVDRGAMWSMRMLDASGQAVPGFIGGNNFWMGDRKDCNYLSNNYTMARVLSKEARRKMFLHRNPNDEGPPFELHFFIADILHHSTLQYHLGLYREDHIMLGLCLPASCTKNDVATMLSKVLRDDNLLVGQLYRMDLELTDVSDLVDDHQWLSDGAVIVSIILLLMLCGTVIASTAYELLVIKKRSRGHGHSLSYENNNTSELKSDPEEKCENGEFTLTEFKTLKSKSSIEEYVECFSLYSNLLQIFDLKTGTSALMIFHCLKFLGMVWIIMVHTIFYGKIFVANKHVAVEMATGFMMQILSNASYVVDTFFFIGGFLLSYVFLREIEKETKPKSLPSRLKSVLLGIVKRYIRLTPVYLVLILVSILNANWYDKISLYRMSENESSLCAKYWWRNLLYIHNFFDFDEMCLTWSWYLSNDMQFFLFGSILLVLSTEYYNVAMGLGATTFLASILWTAYVAYQTDYTPALDKQLETLSALYIRPWTRIAPYLMGMATAIYLIHRNYKLHLSKKLLFAGWLTAIFCNCSILFGLTNHDLSSFLSIFYVSVTRAAWGIGIAWLVIVCCTNQGGILTKFLSLPLWVPLGRLTFCAYLINPFLILSIFRASTYSGYIDVLTIGALSFGITVTTYICAIFVSAIAEVSFIQVLRIINKKQK